MWYVRDGGFSVLFKELRLQSDTHGTEIYVWYVRDGGLFVIFTELKLLSGMLSLCVVCTGRRFICLSCVYLTTLCFFFLDKTIHISRQSTKYLASRSLLTPRDKQIMHLSRTTKPGNCCRVAIFKSSRIEQKRNTMLIFSPLNSNPGYFNWKCQSNLTLTSHR